MRTLTTALISVAAGLLLLQAPLAHAQAKPAQLQAAQSELSFTSRQMGVPVEGRFKRFEAQLNFDPKKPETGKVGFTIDLASVSLGAPELESELATAPWFDSKTRPQASFQRPAVKAAGAGKFEVAGKLTLKGQTRDIVVPITLAQAGALSTATGGFILKRLEFKVGDGEWSDTSIVANDVQIKFKLVFNGVAPL
ncbi:YceI family protein [Paucibacter sp. XJ19-41]|uniref:YceI family protein n=1 Tax=Paucibacter sp. XJ19-41 TaxID=2927824 RepID=UPI0023496518|nr:YceI family protein [Paucibacter sp. XJ19-41]MDC6169714.1 YceI family protein [Paucibacter sp. XJ19-41]